jgi:hypothetical protein
MTISLKNLKVAKKDHSIYGGKIQTYPIILSKKKLMIFASKIIRKLKNS